ncbi:DUF397 domain-containing protein [Actinomadura sp. K4S16]|uniref:DUF397 domain-containing protein n=1 Tax=Actinomadura sp. K4S16 TaxID=1316147 RepID=UPI0011ED427F|nr:DUF397 domain-containing protein [Actinomadura sp. K4S16]
MTGRDLSRLDWRKSTRSGGVDDNSSCIEVASIGGRSVAARDSKDPDGPVLQFDAHDWAAFLARLKQAAAR